MSFVGHPDCQEPASPTTDKVSPVRCGAEPMRAEAEVSIDEQARDNAFAVAQQQVFTIRC